MSPDIAGLVLAGGRGRRLGERDKALVDLDGRPLLAHVMTRFAPQCGPVLISANGDPERFAAWSVPVVADAEHSDLGPLAGLLAGLDWLAVNRPDVARMTSVSVDTPFLPPDLVARLAAARKQARAELACATSAGRRHPVVTLWPVNLRETIRGRLAEGGMRSVDALLRSRSCVEVAWPDKPHDPFFNINHPQDLERAHELLRGRGG